MIMCATEQQADDLLMQVRPLCTGRGGKSNLVLGVDIINGMLCKYYYLDEPSSLNINGEVSKESVKHALLLEDSLTIQHFIDELESKQ